MYHIFAFRFLLSFGIHIKHIEDMPMYYEEEDRQQIGDFTGLVLNLPFCELLFGKLEPIVFTVPFE